MGMNAMKECILKYMDFPPEELEIVSERFSPKTLKKGEFLLRSGTPCREMAFIVSGYLRIFDWVSDKEVTIWIGTADSFITSLSSFVFETPNHWNIQAVTDCELLVIGRQDHFELLKKVPKWLEFDNLLLAKSFAHLEQLMFSQLHTTAQQRFKDLMDENPSIFHHVPLQYIASLLGITPEHLSRLRKDLASSIS